MASACLIIGRVGRRSGASRVLGEEMNRLSLVRLVLLALGAFGATSPLAQQALEIIPLRHRTVEQVLPPLQALLEPGGTLSGSRGQLFLRASPANAAEIKQALAAIDRPAKRLQISVRFNDAQDAERRELSASGTISNRGARVDATAEQARRAGAERVDQRLQVLEGGRAFIMTGQSRPLSAPGETVIQDFGTGFEVVPRVSGADVTLEILQQRELAGSHPGTVQGQRLSSVIRARLGEWMEIGGTVADRRTEERGIGSARSARAGDSRRVWVKVEELAN